MKVCYDGLLCEVLMVGDGKLDYNKAIAEMTNSALNDRHDSELCLFTLGLPPCRDANYFIFAER